MLFRFLRITIFSAYYFRFILHTNQIIIMCKQIDNSLVNDVKHDELCNKSLRSHLRSTRLFKNLDLETNSNNDNNDDCSENDSSEAGSILLEEFPCANGSEHKSIFSIFQYKHRSNSRRRRKMNVVDPARDAMDVTIRDGLRNMSFDRSDTLQASEISQVKYASLDSEQLKQLKNCTRPCLSALHGNGRKTVVDMEQLICKNRICISMCSMSHQQSNSLYSFDTI